MATDMTNVALFCAPDEATYTATCEDLYREQAVLFEAATVVADVPVPFVICGNPLQPTVLLGAPLDQKLDEAQLQHLAQGIIDFHRAELVKHSAGSETA